MDQYLYVDLYVVDDTLYFETWNIHSTFYTYVYCVHYTGSHREYMKSLEAKADKFIFAILLK